MVKLVKLLTHKLRVGPGDRIALTFHNFLDLVARQVLNSPNGLF